MRLIAAVLLMSTSAVCLQGTTTADEVSPRVDRGLHCQTDYLFTINCSLVISPACGDDCSYRLAFIQRLFFGDDEVYECLLSGVGEGYSCSLDKSLQTPADEEPESFVDTDSFEVSLCHRTSEAPERCEALDDEYMPAQNITPNTPCCLNVTLNSSQHHFSWQSGYTDLPFTSTYQLQYSQRHAGQPRLLQTDDTEISVDDGNLVPDTEYSARVRSSPDQAVYKGQWSGWSSAVHWTTAPPRNTSSSGAAVLDKRLVIPLCMLAPLLLLLCYAPVLKLRRNTFIPTPAPYFESLYSECHGDFKTWVVTPAGNEADLLKTEETLQIDVLTRSPADDQGDGAPEEEREDGPHHPAPDAPLLGTPYRVTPGPLKSLSLSSAPGSSLEGDSGCWLCSATSLEADSGPWYRNEYCTLSDTLSVFQAAEHRCPESAPGGEVANCGDYVNEC